MGVLLMKKNWPFGIRFTRSKLSRTSESKKSILSVFQVPISWGYVFASNNYSESRSGSVDLLISDLKIHCQLNACVQYHGLPCLL
jgi:hypothetical protein